MSLMEHNENPLAGVCHHAGPLKDGEVRGFPRYLITDPQALPDACERRNNDDRGYPCE